MAIRFLQRFQTATILSNEPRTTDGAKLLYRDIYSHHAKEVIYCHFMEVKLIIFVINIVYFSRCVDDMSGIDRTPCCESAKFPYPPHIFDQCLPQTISILYESPRYVFVPGIAGPKFERLPAFKNDESNRTEPLRIPKVKVAVVEFESTQSYTMSYAEMENFTTNIENWFSEQLSSAPPGMQNGWFISELDFYDLQKTLSENTVSAICVAMIVSLIVLMFVTLNMFISILAVITVTLSIFTTVGALVVMGWKLNVLESISVSTAIGLAVDFTLHYGVAYRLSPMSDRESATQYSLSRMFGPTIMAAITTGAAGAFMLPSKVLAYTQIGTFLLLVMGISWFFATLFFMSVLNVIGPQHGFGQLTIPKLNKRENKNGNSLRNDYNKHYGVRGTVSEQLLSASSSAAGDFIASEAHELCSLKPSTLEVRPINFDRAFRRNYVIHSKDPSPTSASAITEVLHNSTP